jgi:RNA polymerase sigma-70 factor (ECF subfamily)
MSLATSRSLLDRVCHSGDNDDWRRLVDLYTPLLRDWLSRRGLQASDRDDLTQDILRVIVEKLPSFRHNGRPGAFRAWLRRITVHCLRRFWRAGRARLTPIGEAFQQHLDDLEDPRSDIREQWDREYDRRVLGSLLRRVEPAVQPSTWSAFAQHVLNGRPVAAVAEDLGLSVNAVLIAKSRVLRRLREAAGNLLD